MNIHPPTDKEGPQEVVDKTHHDASPNKKAYAGCLVARHEEIDNRWSKRQEGSHGRYERRNNRRASQKSSVRNAEYKKSDARKDSLHDRYEKAPLYDGIDRSIDFLPDNLIMFLAERAEDGK